MKGLQHNLVVAPIVDVSVLPGGANIRPERRRALLQAVEALPEELRVVLSLRYVEGFADPEIAWLLQQSEPRVAELHEEALLKLQGALHR